ncbi:MAG: hypothetical protein WCO67_23610, partial [Betaproteobacteria bacterium]
RPERSWNTAGRMRLSRERLAHRGGLSIRSAEATQTFNGNVGAVFSGLTVSTSAGLTLTGTNLTGVIGSNAVSLGRGTLTLDNSGGNTSAGGGRISDSATLSFSGGKLALIGHSSGTSETVGVPTFTTFSNTVSVTSNSSSAPTTLTFNNTSGNISTSITTINFTGEGGILGAGGNNPAIKFATPLFTAPSSGLLTSSSGAESNLGRAIVTTGGDVNWAGYDPTNGIIALTNTPRDQTNLASAGLSERIGFAPTGPGTTTTLAANLTTAGVIKITPGATGQSLDLAPEEV